MTKKNKDQEKYSLTLKGLIATLVNFNETTTNKIIDGLELHLRRNYMTEPNTYGAIIFDGKDFIFTQVEKHDGK